MARKRGSPPAEPAPEQRAGVTPERFARLHRLLEFLRGGAKTRAQLTRHLKLDVRGFYRDLELLRAAGIRVALAEGEYALEGDADAAVERLPFPDAHLTLGEARRLARGRTAAHLYLQERIDQTLS
jgi:hypothetical protein